MVTQVIIAARCNWCSRQLMPSDLMRLSSNQAMCARCHEWHSHALHVLTGGMPRGCQHCRLTVDELNALTNSATTRMYVVPMDGIYAVLCLACKDDYCRKRSDLYKATQFGERLKL